MDTNPIPSPLGPTTAPAPQAPEPQSSAVLSSDFEVFLNMLTAQARYQDPLEPIDSSEYAAQLAQFSMVEQQVATNDLMEQLLTSLTTSQTGNLSQWIGMEALTTAPVQFDGNTVRVNPNPPAAADEMYLVVRDAAGSIVQTRPYPVSSNTIEWDGRSDTGSLLPSGLYTLDIESRAAGEVLEIEPARAYSRVVESRLEGGEMMLVLGSGALVRSSDVLGLREPA